MGVITSCYKCESCGDPFRLRYNLGNKYPQTAIFICSECGETLKYGFDFNQESSLSKLIEIDFDRDLKVVNLHPELIIDQSGKEDPLYFPSIEFLRKQSQRGLLGLDMFGSAQASCIDYQNAWDAIQTDFRYLKEGRWKFLEPEYGRDEEQAEHEVLMRVFYTGDFFLQGKWAIVSDDLLKLISVLYPNTGFSQLKSFLSGFKQEFLFNKMYAVMNKYRQVEAGLLPTLLHQKCSFSPEGLSSTCDWDNLEMVYGDFFEIYADLLIVPTVLNNLSARGDYQRFNSPDFTLTKYLSSDKSGRSENFKTYNILKPLSDFYDSSIRNGTHHKASSFDNNTQMITFRTGKDGKTLKEISLVNYIEHCNEIYARILIVLRSFYFIIHLTP